jgi:hypothetical protein
MSKPRYDWESIRNLFETGRSVASLAKQFGCSRQAIMKRAEAEGWTQDAEERINRAARAKVGHYDAAATGTTKEQAIEAEATKRAGIIQGHRELFAKVRTLIDEALAAREVRKVVVDGKAREEGGTRDAFDRMKLAKITSEAARNVMIGERMAYGIAEGEERPGTELPEDDLALLRRWGAGSNAPAAD